MSACITYEIPASLMDAYRGRKTVVRSHYPSEIVARITEQDLGGISHIRLMALDGEIGSLKAWGEGIPLELVVSDPCRDLPLLYQCAPLRGSHPIRVSVPLAPGFGNVVKLAASLEFAVRIEGGQPDAALCEELLRIASVYLHKPTVTEPIEFIHSLFLAFFNRIPVTLWEIQEEDPALFRHVTDQGAERLAGRFSGMAAEEEVTSFLRGLGDGSTADADGCSGCGFRLNCRGYFKWPRRDYDCDGVKALMQALLVAAGQLRADLAPFRSAGEGEGT